MTHSIDRLNRSAGELARNLGREPAVEELAARMKVSPDALHDLMEVARETVSLESPAGFDGGHLGDVVEDTTAINPLTAAIASDRTEKVGRALAAIKPRYADVLRMRYGIGHPGEQTLREVGHTLGVSRERVRQLEVLAMEKLQASCGTKRLRSMLDG